MIILKARQQGPRPTRAAISTTQSHNNQHGRRWSLRTTLPTRAFDMTKRYHENCPEILSHTKYSSRRELSFDVLSSSFVVATRVETVLAG